MKFGINLLLWDYFIDEKYYSIFSEIKKMGYHGVEIPLGIGDDKHYKELAHVISNEGLDCTCTINGNSEHNLLSGDKKIQSRGVDFIRNGLEMAQLLGSRILGGPFYCSPSKFSGYKPSHEELNRSAQITNQLAEYASLCDVRICAEFLNHFECYLLNTVKQTRDWVDLVDHPNVGIHYDTHHVHYEEKNIEEAIMCGGDKIYHIHFSENHRGAIGQGLVDWKETVRCLKEIGYDDWIVFEAFSSKNSELRRALKIWRDLFKDELKLSSEGLKFMRKVWCV